MKFCTVCDAKLEEYQHKISLEKSKTESEPQSIQEIMQKAKQQSESVKTNSVIEIMNRAKELRKATQEYQQENSVHSPEPMQIQNDTEKLTENTLEVSLPTENKIESNSATSENSKVFAEYWQKFRSNKLFFFGSIILLVCAC